MDLCYLGLLKVVLNPIRTQISLLYNITTKFDENFVEIRNNPTVELRFTKDNLKDSNVHSSHCKKPEQEEDEEEREILF